MSPFWRRILIAGGVILGVAIVGLLAFSTHALFIKDDGVAGPQVAPAQTATPGPTPTTVATPALVTTLTPTPPPPTASPTLEPVSTPEAVFEQQPAPPAQEQPPPVGQPPTSQEEAPPPPLTQELPSPGTEEPPPPTTEPTAPPTATPPLPATPVPTPVVVADTVFVYWDDEDYYIFSSDITCLETSLTVNCQDQALGWALECMASESWLLCDLVGLDGGGFYNCHKSLSGDVYCESVLGVGACLVSSFGTTVSCLGGDGSSLICARSADLFVCADSLGQTFSCGVLVGQFWCD